MSLEAIGLSVLIVGTLLPTIGPAIVSGGLTLVAKAINGVNKIQKKRKKKNKKYQAKLQRQRELYNSINHRYSQRFSNIKNKNGKDFSVLEMNHFDPEQDSVYRGILHVKMPNGQTSHDEIYLFQPRVYVMGKDNQKTLIGPRKSAKGHLCDEYCYAVAESRTNEIYSSYFPKREVVSGMTFDYVNQSCNVQEGELTNYMNIEIPQDKDGNFIPVDLNVPDEKRKFENYIQSRTTTIDAIDFLKQRLEWAKEAYNEWVIENRPKYAKPVEELSEAEEHRIERTREAKEARDKDLAEHYRHLKYRPPRPPMGTLGRGPMGGMPHGPGPMPGPFGGPHMPMPREDAPAPGRRR